MRRGLVILFLLVASQASAAPPPLDRIVAVVDQGVITLSELRARARPHLHQMAEKSGGKKPEKPAVDALYAELLQQLINERLVASDAEARHISVTSDEIDQGLNTLATSNKITLEQLYAEVERVGMSRADYREEVRRQILDGKWSMYAVRRNVTVERTDEKAFLKAMDEEHGKELERLRKSHYIEVRK